MIESEKKTAQKLYDLLNEIHLILHHSDRQILAGFELSIPRFYVLHHTYCEVGLSLQRLSELTFLDKASISRMVFDMEREGLIEREVNAKDRRSHSLKLSFKGLELYQKAHQAFETDLVSRFLPLCQQSVPELISRLSELNDTLRGHLENIQKNSSP
ncbi:MAG: MarR family transcriptional regulator [Deinococcales bacterium]